MKNIEAILFDLGNTLTASASLVNAFADLAHSPLAFELGLDAEVLLELGKEIDQSIAHLYDGSLHAQPHWLDLWKTATDRHQIDLDTNDVDRLCRAHLSQFVSQCEVQPYSIPLLTFLKAQNIPLALVSNVSGPVEIFEADLQKKGLADFFSATVWSSGVGYRKPDPAIFNIALDTLGVEASNRVLMVGDSEVADIWVATQWGSQR